MIAYVAVNMIPVFCKSALEKSVSGGHGHFPRCTIRVNAASLAPLRVLYGDTETVHGDVTVAVITGFKLRLRRVRQVVQVRGGGLMRGCVDLFGGGGFEDGLDRLVVF